MRDYREFQPDTLSFMVYMTRREWQLVYSFTFAAQAEDIVPLSFTLGDLFRWGITYLQQECGYQFEWLKMMPDRTLVALTEKPIEPRIVNWIQQIKLSLEHPGYAPPNYLIHLPVAIEYARERVPDHARIVEMMESALRDLREVKRQVEKSEPDEETRRAIRAGIGAAREFIAEQRGRGPVN